MCMGEEGVIAPHTRKFQRAADKFGFLYSICMAQTSNLAHYSWHHQLYLLSNLVNAVYLLRCFFQSHGRVDIYVPFGAEHNIVNLFSSFEHLCFSALNVSHDNTASLS